MSDSSRWPLTHYAWLSIAAALSTIGLKTGAFLLTGSVGLLSDALESVVNLVGAVLALIMLTIAARPADEDHAYGHSKAEYFSSVAEGTLILIAAAAIIFSAVQRLITPEPLENIGIGLAVSGIATLINLGTATVLLRAGRSYHSIALEADARHLLTDVWTSVGVWIGVGIVALTGWGRLDPLVALVVAANIVWAGGNIVRRSVGGLMDAALPETEQAAIRAVLQRYQAEGIQHHALRTRQSGARRFASVHVLVPGDWTVQRGHSLLEDLEHELCASVPNLTVLTHLEPLDDPASWDDVDLDRARPTRP